MTAGAIPLGWATATLGDLFEVRAGGDWDSDNFTKVHTATNRYAVVANALQPGAVQGWSPYFGAPGGSLTITGRGDVGKAVFRPEPYVPIVRLLALIPRHDDSARFYTEYVNSFVSFPLESTGVPQLTAPQVRPIEVLRPPTREQRAIAETLADVDGLILAQVRLIAKKRLIKQGMMQELIAGRTRLPGFAGNWTLEKLEGLSRMSSGGTPSSAVSKYYGGSIPWVSISDMTRGGKYLRTTVSSLTSEGLSASAAKLYDESAVLYAMYASIGECSIAIGRVSSSQAILGISVGPRLDREFLYYFLESIKPRVKLMGQHGTQSNLNAGMVRNFDVLLPAKDEQVAIANVLGVADAEIEALERRLESTRNIKQGMMQELLTGRTRLKVSEVAA